MVIDEVILVKGHLSLGQLPIETATNRIVIAETTNL